MRLPLRVWIAAIVVALAAGGIWLVLEFQPGRQVTKAMERARVAVEKRHWKHLDALLHPDYADSFSQNREEALANAQEVLRHFFVVHLAIDGLEVEVRDRSATIRASVTLGGSGNAIAQAVIQEVAAAPNRLESVWIRNSWKPWDWSLVRLEAPGW